jgi:hypothetical protein
MKKTQAADDDEDDDDSEGERREGEEGEGEEWGVEGVRTERGKVAVWRLKNRSGGRRWKGIVSGVLFVALRHLHRD